MIVHGFQNDLILVCNNFQCVEMEPAPLIGLDARYPHLMHTNNKGADQPVHPCSLTSAFDIRPLEGIMTPLDIL